ncbi:hypothetical protein T265_04803 [Opisthorchis viverrini]|uniref:Uncharacterized protein n=1 Tax=Opisthorchis viverrini TaxID=6198 RepID=A0A075AG34_OPIVI|nr:hypothetical protein T265_04803 [Opisthorchis viverrini]KER28344.1 hypothetical protein T265_04803 [Opisthorchis viverrini]
MQQSLSLRPFQCMVAMPPGESTRVEILSSCPSLDNSSRDSETRLQVTCYASQDRITCSWRVHHHHHRQHDISVQHQCFTAVQTRPICKEKSKGGRGRKEKGGRGRDLLPYHPKETRELGYSQLSQA